MKSRIEIAAVAFALFTACSSTPEGILPQHAMARLLADVHEAEGVVETDRSAFYSDSMKTVLRESVYRHHNVTAEQVDSSLSWYGRNIEKYMDVYDEVIEILDKRLADANAISASTKSEYTDASTSIVLEGDSVNVWTISPRRRFYHQGANNYIVYRIQRDRNWEDGDIYTLRYKLVNPSKPVSALIVAEYNDGTADQRTAEGSGHGRQEIKLRLDPDKKATAVAVSLNYDTDPGEVMFIDSISLVRERKGRARP